MHYQVVAKALNKPGGWEYYPYWAPGSDKRSAERLARYAAQSGYESAILQCYSLNLLETVGRQVVEQQDTQVLPAQRYRPKTEPAGGTSRSRAETEHALPAAPQVIPEVEICGEETNTQTLDLWRLDLEAGAGGDVTLSGNWHAQQFALPQRMDVLSAWVGLSQRVARGEVGGSEDGEETAA